MKSHWRRGGEKPRCEQPPGAAEGRGGEGRTPRQRESAGLGAAHGAPPLAHLPPVLPPGPGQPPCGGAARLSLTLLPLLPAATTAAAASRCGGRTRVEPSAPLGPEPLRPLTAVASCLAPLLRAAPPPSHLPCTPPRARAPTPQDAAAPLRGAAPASVSLQQPPRAGAVRLGAAPPAAPLPPRASRSPSFFPRSPSSQRGGGGSGGGVTDREPGSGRPRALPSSPLARRGRWRRQEKA